MRRRQIYAERYPSTYERLPLSEETERKLDAFLGKDACPQCGKTGLKNVGAHRRFCRG